MRVDRLLILIAGVLMAFALYLGISKQITFNEWMILFGIGLSIELLSMKIPKYVELFE